MAFVPFKTRHNGAPAAFVGTANATIAAGDLCSLVATTGKWTKAATSVAGPLAVAAQALATNASGTFYAAVVDTIFRCAGHTQALITGLAYQYNSTTMGLASTAQTLYTAPSLEVVEFVEDVATDPAVVIHIGRASS
jgi:hypothetical protein